METQEQLEILRVLDWERRTVIYPGVVRLSDTGVVRDVSEDGRSGEVVYSSFSEEEADQTIEHQIQTARRERYGLEWKVYGHDHPRCLGERLAAAGFEAGAEEAFMVFLASHASLDRFGACRHDIRRITSPEGLRDYQVIREEVSGKDCENEIQRYGLMLRRHPSNLSVYVAYMDGEPAACGRVYFHESSRFAGLYGGNTRERFRRRGLFTQLVAARIREALSRGVVTVCVDALPTSEPILRKHGFERMTYTQPFCFSG